MTGGIGNVGYKCVRQYVDLSIDARIRHPGQCPELEPDANVQHGTLILAQGQLHIEFNVGPVSINMVLHDRVAPLRVYNFVLSEAQPADNPHEETSYYDDDEMRSDVTEEDTGME